VTTQRLTPTHTAPLPHTCLYSACSRLTHHTWLPRTPHAHTTTPLHTHYTGPTTLHPTTRLCTEKSAHAVCSLVPLPRTDLRLTFPTQPYQANLNWRCATTHTQLDLPLPSSIIGGMVYTPPPFGAAHDMPPPGMGWDSHSTRYPLPFLPHTAPLPATHASLRTHTPHTHPRTATRLGVRQRRRVCTAVAPASAKAACLHCLRACAAHCSDTHRCRPALQPGRSARCHTTTPQSQLTSRNHCTPPPTTHRTRPTHPTHCTPVVDGERSVDDGRATVPILAPGTTCVVPHHTTYRTMFTVICLMGYRTAYSGAHLTCVLLTPHTFPAFGH